jgi:hypothetical protein
VDILHLATLELLMHCAGQPGAGLQETSRLTLDCLKRTRWLCCRCVAYSYLRGFVDLRPKRDVYQAETQFASRKNGKQHCDAAKDLSLSLLESSPRRPQFNFPGLVMALKLVRWSGTRELCLGSLIALQVATHGRRFCTGTNMQPVPVVVESSGEHEVPRSFVLFP